MHDIKAMGKQHGINQQCYSTVIHHITSALTQWLSRSCPVISFSPQGFVYILWSKMPSCRFGTVLQADLNAMTKTKSIFHKKLFERT